MQQRLLDEIQLRTVVWLLKQKGCDIEEIYRRIVLDFLVDLDDLKRVVKSA